MGIKISGNPDMKKTYVFIDVSNIRVSCLTSCGMNLDFVKFYRYLREKYGENLAEARYYEGLARDDEKKKENFNFLGTVGYKICAFPRHSYTEPAKYGVVKCVNCGHVNKVLVERKEKKFKSNVDVYLATDMLELAATSLEAIHVVLVSCDGDFAEPIRAVLRLAPPGSNLTVIGTPKLKDKHQNSLSTRLKNLCREYDPPMYNIDSIANLGTKVSRHLFRGQKAFIAREKAEREDLARREREQGLDQRPRKHKKPRARL